MGIHLIGMECKKVLMSRSFQRLWLFLLAVFSFLTLWMEGEGSRSGYRPADYELLYEGLSEYTPAEAVEILEETKTAVKTRMEQTLLLESRLPDTGAFQGGFSGSENTEMRGLPGKQEKLLLADFLPGDDWAAVMLLEDVSREAGAVERRDSLLRETVANADRLLSVALFRSQMEEGTQGNVEKTRADFIKAQPIAVDRVTSEKGMRLLFDDPLGDMFVLILVFYSLSVMVAVGYNNGMELLVLSCRKGGGKSVFYRSMALILLNGVIWLSFFLCRCACSRFLYSWGSLLRPLQSMSDYVKCLFPISVGGMIAIFFFWKWLWFSLLGLLMLGLLKVFQKEIVSLLAVLGLWGAGFALYRGLADNSVFRIWKYENAYLLLRPDLIWGTYNNYQLGSMWVSGWVLAVSFTSGAALVVGLLLFFFRERLLIRDRGRRILAHPKKAHFVGLKSGELYKNYLALPIALALLLLALLQMGRYQGEAIRLGQESLVYRSYMSRWERSLKERDPELEEEMMEEEQELLRAISGKSEHYEPETAALLIQGLYRAKERYSQSIMTAASRGEEVRFFFEEEYALLIGNRPRDLEKGAQSSFLVLLFMAAAVGIEHQSGMRSMIRSTGKGGQFYAANKLLWLASLSFLVLALVYLPDLWLTAQTYSLHSAGSFVASHPALTEFPLPVSIGGYLFLLCFWRFLVLVLVGLVVLVLAELFRNGIVGGLVAAVLLWLPYFLYYLGVIRAGDWGLAGLL